jgi:hypothetical protein
VNELSAALAINEALRAKAAETAEARFKTLAPGERAVFTLPTSQPDQRDCYVVIATRARYAFGSLGYRLRRIPGGVEVTRETKL